MKHVTLLTGYDDGTVREHMGVEFEGGLWLVTTWLVDRASGIATPERMVRLDTLPHPPQRCSVGDPYDYANVLLPRSVIEGRTEDAPGYEVRSLPDSPRARRSDLRVLPGRFP